MLSKIGQPLVTDEFSKGVVLIDTAHARIHSGEAFIGGHLWDDGNQIADNANAELLIQAGSGMHTIFDIACGGDCELHYFESPTFSAAGTPITIFNKNRFSTNVSLATLTYAPTITADGTALPAKFLPGGSGGNAAGGTNGFEREFILKTGLDYLIRVINRSGLARSISINSEWYEIS